MYRKKRGEVDSRHGPVTRPSQEDLDRLKAAQPKAPAVEPIGRAFIIPKKFLERFHEVRTTDTEVLQLIRDNSDRLNVGQRTSMIRFRLMITRGEEFSDPQLTYLCKLIDICRSPRRQFAKESAADHDLRVRTAKAFIALFETSASDEQVELVFSKGTLDELKARLTPIMQAHLIMCDEAKVTSVVYAVARRLGFLETSLWRGDFPSKKEFYRSLFSSFKQENSSVWLEQAVSQFPTKLAERLVDERELISVDRFRDVARACIDDVSQQIPLSVGALPAGSPGSGKGGVQR